MQFILFQRFYFYFLSFAPYSFGIFLWRTRTPRDAQIQARYGIYGCNYKDLQGLGHEVGGGGLLQLQAAGYDMFISVCVSFLMIFNYARDSYFTRAIKRSILYSAFRCRQQHQAAPDRVGEVATLAAVASGAGIGLHTKRTKA